MRVNIGLTAEEFGRLSLREIDALLTQYKLKERAEYWRTAAIVSMIHNTNIEKKSQAKDIEYFIPEVFREKRKKKSWQEMLMTAQAVTASVGKGT